MSPALPWTLGVGEPHCFVAFENEPEEASVTTLAPPYNFSEGGRRPGGEQLARANQNRAPQNRGARGL